MLDAHACYRALTARDGRFDGLFFAGVTTTGIYCRPVCRARTPRADRVRFYRTAAEAEHHGFRACLRCRPELAPGRAPVDSVHRLVDLAVARIEAGALEDRGLEGLARSLAVSSRHLRRAFRSQLGVSPIELAQSRRLALARQLLLDTGLSMTDVAFAAGFGSLRRFNALFRARSGRAPSELSRRRVRAGSAETVRLSLGYRAPYAWDEILGFLRARAIPGVEVVSDGVYLRTVRTGEHRGWLRVAHRATSSALDVEISLSLVRAIAPLVARVRRVFDLDAEPHPIGEHLRRDPRLRPLVAARPGLRVPGAFDAFESAARAVLGQQVSVAAATTLAGRLAARFGDPVETPHDGLAVTFPAAATIARAPEPDLVGLGILPARARTLRALADEALAGRLAPDSADVPSLVERLRALPGIGDWTAQVIAMRALHWPDAFPAGDLGVRTKLGGITEAAARALAEPWRPWRAYAVMHLWEAP